MKSNAKQFGIFTLLAMATTVGTVCAQTLPPIERPNRTPSQDRSLLPETSRNLPPIINGAGAQNSMPPIVSGTRPTVPPIESNAQSMLRNSAAAEAQRQGLRPIVAEQATPQLPAARQEQSPIQNFGKPTSASLTGNRRQGNPLRPVQLPQLLENNPTEAELGTDQPHLLPQTLNRPQSGQLLSTSGVPFYSSNRRPENRNVRFSVEQPYLPDGSNLPSSSPSANETWGGDSGLIQEPTLQPQVQQPAASHAAPERANSVMTQRESSGRANLPGETNAQPRTTPRGTPRTTPSMGAGGVPNANAQWAGESNYFEMAPGQAEFTPGCQDCLNAGGMANCPTCGNMGAYGYGNGTNGEQVPGYFGAMSRARRYAELDLLYMTRTDGSIVLSNFGGLGSFDWDWGWRVTLGGREDETQGREFSYFGTQDLSKTENRTDPGFRLSALFTPAGVIDPSLAAPFFDANIQNESMQTRLHSFEINRVRWAWDVVKSFVGIRYIYVDDSYNLFSQQGVNTADYQLESLNNLIGVHIGRELFYDVGYRLSFSGMGKFGIYGNANRFSVNASNNGVSFLNNRTDSAAFSTSLDLLLTGHYQINRRARLRMGYQALLLDQIYSVSDNLTGVLSPFNGSRDPDEDSMFFHGLNFGLEFYR